MTTKMLHAEESDEDFRLIVEQARERESATQALLSGEYLAQCNAQPTPRQQLLDEARQQQDDLLDCGKRNAREPDLWRGLDIWSEDYFQQLNLRAVARDERLDASAFARHMIEKGAEGGIPFMPGFTWRDWDGTSTQPLNTRDSFKRAQLLADFAREHDERHDIYAHPFCVGCRGGVAAFASESLTRWIILNPGRTPRDTWDGSLPMMPPATDAAVSPFLNVDELLLLTPAEMLFGEIVPQGSLGYITGRDGTYKTFLALDLALHLVTGRAWNGRPVEFGGYGRVLFVAGEGVHSFPKRIAAWVAHHCVEHDVLVQTGISTDSGLATWERTGEMAPGLSTVQKGSLIVRNGAVDLYGGKADFAQLIAKVKEQMPDLIFIDTLNASAGAAEQNSASDMSVITARIRAIRSAAGPTATVIVIAHTTKADTDARGSSAIEDDADFVLHCKRDEDRLRVRIAKMKDGESGQDINLKVLSVGDSLVLLPGEPEPVSQWASDVIAQRIRGVLYSVRDLDPPTATQILGLVKDDGTGKPAGRAMVYRTLGELQRSGEISVSGTTSKGVTKPQHWKLNKSAYPPDER